MKIDKPFDWIAWDTWSEIQWYMLQELRSKDNDLKGSGLNFRKNIGIQHWGMMTDLNKLAVQQLRACKVNQLFTMQEKLDKDELSGAIYGGTVDKQGKEKKVVTFKYKPKKHTHTKQGHRQPYTKVTINKINA